MESRSDESDPGDRDHHFSLAFVLLLVGPLLVLQAVVTVVLSIVVAATDAPPVVVGAWVGCAVLVTALLAGWLRRTRLVTLTDQGYAVRLVRGTGRRTGAWRDVEDAQATSRRGVRCVDLRLRDGGRTTIPVGLLATDAEELVRDLQHRLQRARGLRPLADEADAATAAGAGDSPAAGDDL